MFSIEVWMVTEGESGALVNRTTTCTTIKDMWRTQQFHYSGEAQ